tara:strand:- start:168410 stop:170404 length:1995 start_codon:yes stop_codon:yes gene_type:complete
MKTKHIITILLCFLIGTTVEAQTFQDNVTNEPMGEFPSKWDVVKGMATIDQLDGTTAISIMHGGIIMPIVNDQTNNYLGDDFTVEFDMFFGKTGSIYGQRIEIRFWEGQFGYRENDISYQPITLKRDGLETSWSHPQPGSAKNFLKELYTLEPVWRHVKIEHNAGKLKIYLDQNLLLNIPKFKMKPTMVSIGGGINDSQNPAKVGVKNVTIFNQDETKKNEPDGTKIILIVDKTTKKVQNIELYETMKDPVLVSKKYPNSTFHEGMLYGNYSLVPNKDAVLAFNTKRKFTPGDIIPEDMFILNDQLTKNFEFLPLKGAKSFTLGSQFLPGDQILLKQQLTTGDQFNLGPINTVILHNNNGVLFLKPKGVEPLNTVVTNTSTTQTNSISNTIAQNTGQVQTAINEVPDSTIDKDSISIYTPLEPIDATITPQILSPNLVEEKPIKLKVTLTDLLCIKKRNINGKVKYFFRQWAYYTANNIDKVAPTSISGDRIVNNNSSKYDTINGIGYNVLANSDSYNPIILNQTGKREGNAMNSLIFEIMPQELKDYSASFKIRSVLSDLPQNPLQKEIDLYSTSINVDINSILADLIKANEGEDLEGFTVPFHDPEILKVEYGLFKTYSSGVNQKLWVRQVGKTLEGPISLGYTTANNGLRGAAWIKFEILN